MTSPTTVRVKIEQPSFSEHDQSLLSPHKVGMDIDNEDAQNGGNGSGDDENVPVGGVPMMNGNDANNNHFDGDEEGEDDDEYGEEYKYNARGRERRIVKKPDHLMYEGGDKKRKMSSSGGKKAHSRPVKKEKGLVRRRDAGPVQYEVEYIWGKREVNGVQEYRVYWKGYRIEESTWEPEENLVDCNESIEKYEERAMYFDSMGERALQAGIGDGGGSSSGSSDKGKKAVAAVNNGGNKYQLKHVLPAMRAPTSSSQKKKKPTSSSRGRSGSRKRKQSSVGHSSIPPLSKKKPKVEHRTPPPPTPLVQSSSFVGTRKRNASFSRPNSSFSRPSSSAAVADHPPPTEGLKAKAMRSIVKHQLTNIEGHPLTVQVLYEDRTTKFVSASDLLDINPKLLASYLMNVMVGQEADD